MGYQLTPADREYIERQLTMMRRHAAQAIEASNRWNRINAALMTKFTAERRTDLEISRAKAVNLALNDAYGAYQFHSAKAQLHAAVIQGELAARNLLDGDDPTGLLYDREEEGPPVPRAPAQRPPGWAVTGRGPHPTVPADVPAVRL